MGMLYRGHAAAHDAWVIERWHAHPMGSAVRRFGDGESALQFLRGFRVSDLRGLAARLLESDSLQRCTDADLQRQLAAWLVAGRIEAMPAFGDAQAAMQSEPDEDEKLLRRLRTTGHSFHFGAERYRIVDARRWAALRGSDDECWQVLPHDEAQALLEPLTHWQALSVDERQALVAVQQRVPEGWRPQQPQPGLLVLRIVPVVTLYRSADAGEAAATPSQLAGRQTEEEVHWVQIELIDAEDQPVPGEAYRIELPGGEVREGRLDKDGRAYLGGLKQGGLCKVCFPDIDTQEWRAA